MITPQEQAELATLEAAFEAAGGRGADLADRIDTLRAKTETPIETVKRLQDQAAEYAVGADRALDDLWEGLGTRREPALWDRVETLLTLAEDSARQLRRALTDARKPADVTT